MKRALATFVVAGALVIPTTSASAGGWWSGIDLDEARYLVSGTGVVARGQFTFETIPEAERVRRTGRFYVYLVTGLDEAVVERAMGRAEPGDWWRLGDAEVTRLGRARLSGWSGNLAHASASFVVPDVLGRHRIMFCDAGCRNPLGDFVPSEVRVVSDRTTANFAARLDRMAQDLLAVRRRAWSASESAEHAEQIAAEVLEVDRELRELRAEVSASRPVRSEPPSIPWVAFAGWFLAGGATVLTGLVVARRRRRRVPATVPPEHIPDDPRELVESGSGVGGA